MAININISIEKRHLVIFSCLIVLFGIVLVTNAFNPSGVGGNPEVMGHSADELQVNFGGTTQNVQQVFNSITDDAGNVNYANTAGTADSANNVEWSNVGNKPSDLATHDWVNNQDYVTQNYVDSNDDELVIGCDWEGWTNTTDGLTYSSYGGYCSTCDCPWGCERYQESKRCENGIVTHINKDICVDCAELDIDINV